MVTSRQFISALQAAFDLPRGKRWWPEVAEDRKAIRRIANSPLLYEAIVEALNKSSSIIEPRYNPPKSGPWIVIVRRNNRTNYVTAASVDDKGNVIAESVQLVNVRGGAHGFSFTIANQLVNYFGGDIAETENIVG